MLKYKRILRSVLRENQVTLYDLDGRSVSLELSRHVCVPDGVRCDEPRLSQGEDTRRLVLQLSVDLWTSWCVHLTRSAYEREWFSELHLELRWAADGEGAPPAILLSNRSLSVAPRKDAEVPAWLSTSGNGLLGEVEAYAFDLPSVGRCLRLVRSGR